MTNQQSTAPIVEYDPERHPQTAFRLARVGLSEEGIARFLEVPAYTVYLWAGEFPAFSEAMDKGWTAAAIREATEPKTRCRYKYPAYTYALQFSRRTKRPELARVLKAKMDEMKAIGPEAAAGFNDALWDSLKKALPLRKVPGRV